VPKLLAARDGDVSESEMMGQASPETGTPRRLASRSNLMLPAVLMCWQ